MSRTNHSYQYLVFDLDETLYPRHSGLMQEIARLIRLYLVERMGFAPEKAEQLRKYFWTRYGTTLRGLQTEYQVDADDYLRFVHDIHLEDYIEPNPSVAEMLRRLPLQKAIFTNADSRHAGRVLDRLELAEFFPVILDIRATEFCNKPDPRAYQLALRALRAEGPECILIEDNARNLRPAKEQWGMTTILVDGQVEEGVDVAVASLLNLEGVVNELVNRKR